MVIDKAQNEIKAIHEELNRRANLPKEQQN
jgi:hypothetical protein